MTRPAAGGVAVLAVIALVARFLTQSPLWLDEALSVNIATLDLGDIPEALRHDGHPPLYYALLHGWTEVFGTSDVAVRALSGVLSVLSLPLAWLAGRRLADRAGGWGAALLVALSPFCVRYATEARMYSLVMLLVLAGLVLVRAALDDGADSWPRLTAIAAISGALLLSHYWAVWIVVATVGVLVVVARRGQSRAHRVTGAIVVGGLALVPWLPSLADQVRHTGTPWGTRVRPTTAVRDTLENLGGSPIGEAVLLGTVVVVLCLVALFARQPASIERVELDLRTVPGARGELAVAGLTMALGTSVGWIVDSTYAARYASVVVPLVLVAAGVGLARLPGRARLVAGAMVAVLSLAGIVNNVVEDRTQAADIASAIHRGAEADDVVLFCPDQLGPAVDRELDDRRAGGLVAVTFPALAPPERVDWADYEDRIAATDPVAFAHAVHDLAGRSRVWYVASGSYRTHRTVCGTIGSALRRLRPNARLVVREDPERFEQGSLTRFESTASP